jgi:fluoroacetyl-CoA thioesterase
MSQNQSTLVTGLKHSEQITVETKHTVPQVDPTWDGFKDMPPVFATAMMIAFIEQTCIMGLKPYLESTQRTVGTHVDVSHVAATPVGMKVIAEVELIEIEGRVLTYKVSCRDETGLIGEGTHRRAIIDVEKFLQRLQGKTSQNVLAR